MYKIVKGRGEGKTQELIELASQNDGVVVCEDIVKMREKVHMYEMPVKQIISYVDFISKFDSTSKYYIDEVEKLLKILNVEGFTLVPDKE